MEYLEGDIIYVQSDISSLIDHMGIVVFIDGAKYIYHNTPDRFNEFGGSICLDSLSTWLTNRKIVKIVHSGIDSYKIRSISYQLRKEKYHFLLFNCEHYIEYIVRGVRSSRQLFNWFVFLALGTMVVKAP